MFITFEGADGVGKSTQVKLLAEYFEDQGREVLLTREPGGNKASDIIRELLVATDGIKWHKETELLLHNAARVEHVKQNIQPALDAGKIVICDRYVDSTMAYQAAGMGNNPDHVEWLHQHMVGGLMPNKTFILDLDLDSRIARTNSRGTDSEAKYENMDLDFQVALRESFLSIAKTNPDRCVLLDAGQEVKKIYGKVLSSL